MRYRRSSCPGATYFFTLVTYGRAPLFSDSANVETWRAAVAKVRRSRPFEVEAEVVLPDHLHVLWQLPEGDADYATRVRLAKTAFTKALDSRKPYHAIDSSRAARNERSVWQRRYWEHVIRDEKDFQAHLDYIHLNPVRHGLVASARDWPYSTFSDWVKRGAYTADWGSSEMPPLPDWAGRE